MRDNTMNTTFKTLAFLFAAAGFSFGFTSENQKADQNAQAQRVINVAFQPGVELNYRFHYGFITGGWGKLTVSPTIKKMNGAECYQIDVKGASSGTLRSVYKVDDLWRSYMDTTDLSSVQAYRDISEGNYKKQETTYFVRSSGNANVVWKRPNKPWKSATYKVPAGTHDIVSGYYYIRNLDFSRISTGTIITLNAFYEDELYNFRVRYEGKTNIKTKLGTYRCLKLIPEMPNNSIFEGKEPIQLYLSDDQNKVPILVRAEMFLGAVELELKSYRNLRHTLGGS